MIERKRLRSVSTRQFLRWLRVTACAVLLALKKGGKLYQQDRSAAGRRRYRRQCPIRSLVAAYPVSVPQFA
eukprot:2946013-Rhodomonas_salina.3